MKASLQLNLSQQITLTPQLQQAIRLLQLSTLDLSQEIMDIVESNPLLELEDISSIPAGSKAEEKPIETTDTAVNDNQWQDLHNVSTRSSGDDLPNLENIYSTSETLQDYLSWQMSLTPFSVTDQAIAYAIIDAINDDGLLTSTIDDILISINQHADPENEIELDEVKAVLHRIQRFDPIGCGAQNLQECLLLQLEQYPKDTPYLAAAKHIIQLQLDLVAQHNYRTLMRKNKLNEQQLQAVLKIIQSLNPKPGNQIASGKTEYVVPDVIVTKRQGAWQVELNPESIPRVKINNNYASLAQNSNKNADNQFIKSHLQEARWFLKSIQSRQDTLFKVACRIVHYQTEFLEHGEEAMKPLILSDIAKDLEMHESTISRVTTQKFMHTPRGVFELKYFFSSHVNTVNGGECSSTAIRAVIKKLIAAENPRKPLSDSKIASIIGEQGIKVARRTIAKYRELMGIPSSNERKSLVD